MSPELWYYVGKFSLYTLIGFGALNIVVACIRKQWKPAIMIGGCFASVIACEIWSYIAEGHSISTGFGMWLAVDPFWGYLWLIFFGLSMSSLVLHLIAYAYKKKPK